MRYSCLSCWPTYKMEDVEVELVLVFDVEVEDEALDVVDVGLLVVLPLDVLVDERAVDETDVELLVEEVLVQGLLDVAVLVEEVAMMLRLRLSCSSR